MYKIDITTTATLRPELLDRTFHSFCKNMFDKFVGDYRLVINIDPVGSKCSAQDVLDVAKNYFGHRVTYNIPNQPSFPKAWKWCWDQVYDADFVFHLEEDWLLLRSVDLTDMIEILNNNANLCTLRMLKMDTPTNLHFFSSKYIVKTGYLQAENRAVSFGGNPALIKGEFVRQSRKYLLEDRNPEKQFRITQPDMWKNIVSKWDYGVYTGAGFQMLVQDIGREWRSAYGFKKANGDNGFIVWEKED